MSTPVPAGRGRWRLTLHRRTFTSGGVTWNQTIISELSSARSRRLVQQWDSPAELTFTLDGRSSDAMALAELQTDIYAWRWDEATGGDICVFRGVLDHSEDQITEQSHTVNFTCHDYLAMVGRRFVLDVNQVVFTTIDQDGLAADLVGRALGPAIGYLPGAHIPVAVVIVDPAGNSRTKSGVIRARTYQGGQNIGEALDDLAKVIGGFDYDIIPEPQAPDNMTALDNFGNPVPLGAGVDAVRIFYPNQGTTRTDLMLIYGGNVSTITRTVSSDVYANYIRILGNNGSSDPAAAQLVGYAVNADASNAVVGFWPRSDNASDVSIQATLDEQAGGALAFYGILQPSYTLGLRPGAYTWGSPRMGDIVPLVVQSGRLNVNTTQRVVGITYDISDDGDENVNLDVGRPAENLVDMLAATSRDVNALARR